LTDIDLVYKKLAFIEACVHELRTLGRPEEVRTDLREQRFEAYTLQMAIQAALDVAAHVVSDERLGFASKNRDYFELLVKFGWLPKELAPVLHNMVGFRNILVHGYEAVDPAVVEKVTRDHLDDLLAFVRAIRERLASE
jgi:uncharacterized protein YutE (UPF0331/DUF86 family)